MGDVRIPAANSYAYAAARTYSVLLGAADFTAENSSTPFAYNGTTDELTPNTTATAYFRAPLHLPQDAIITGLTLLAYDAVAGASNYVRGELVTYGATANASTSRVIAATAVTTAATGQQAPDSGGRAGR